MADITPEQYRVVVAKLRHRVKLFAADQWTGLGSWRDADIDGFVNRLLPVVIGAERRIATITDAFLSAQLGDMFGVASAPRGLDVDSVTGEAIRNGAPPDEVYRRPAVATYKALSDGEPLDVAVRRGAERLGALIDTDMQLTKTHAARAVLADSPADYYRRTLNGSHNCALCVVASTQRYKVSKLMPIHTHCDCGITPVKGRVPHVLDKQQLDTVHAAVERVTGEKLTDRTGRTDVDYRKILVVHKHGEYGPTLSFKGQEFTGPSDIK